MKKMNNKGFSLVELIVVVLIMAIIAVALAPQVMKWVENSRKSNDIENYNALVGAANVAGTDESVLKAAKIKTSEGATITFATAGTSIDCAELAAAMKKTLPDLNADGSTTDKIKVESSWDGGNTTFEINVKLASDGTGIVVTKVAGKFPVKNFS